MRINVWLDGSESVRVGRQPVFLKGEEIGEVVGVEFRAADAEAGHGDMVIVTVDVHTMVANDLRRSILERAGGAEGTDAR